MIAGARLVSTGTPKSDPAITNTRYSGRQVEEIIRFLETKYVGNVNADELVSKAIKAILEDMDPHTHYFPPDQMDELEEKTTGHYVGIGIEVAFLGDSLVILYPKKDSPASKAGIMPGDHIEAVNDHPIPHDTLDQMEAISMIKGKKGTSVKLKLRSMLSDSVRVVEVVRDEIKIPSVVSAYMLDSTVAYIKLARFTNTTYREFMDEWERMYTNNNARDLILDMRDNPGGYLKEAVNILSQIIEPEGKLLVYTKGRNEERVEYKSTGKVFFPVKNICVLINEGSASASEIIAGCIQDQDRGLVIGERSYGKGLVQEQYELSNGGILRMTVSKYYTPSGRSIQKPYDSLSVVDTMQVFKTARGRAVFAGGGISPDILVTDSINWHDLEQKKWMDVISEYAIRYNLLHHQGQLAPIEEMQSIKRSLPSLQTMMGGLMKLAERRMPKSEQAFWSYYDNNAPVIERITKATLVAYRTGESGWYIAYNEEDPVVQKARTMIRLDLLMALQQN